MLFRSLKECGRACLSSSDSFANLEDHELYTKYSKCEFWLNEVVFLRHVVFGNGIFVNPKKVEAIVN